MKWTSFAMILMVGSLTLATASDAQAREGHGGHGGHGGFGSHGGGGGILGGLLGGLARGMQGGNRGNSWGRNSGWDNHNNGNWLSHNRKHRHDEYYEGEGGYSDGHDGWRIKPDIGNIVTEIVNGIPQRQPQRIIRYPSNYTPTSRTNKVAKPLKPPKPNKIDVAAKVKENSDFSLTAQGMTAEALAAWKSQAQQQNEAVLGEIGKLIGQDATEALGDVSRKANGGVLTTADLHAFAARMRPGLGVGMTQSANELFNRLAVLSRLTALLNTAIPGAGGPIPVGNRVPIVLVPGLPRGQVIVLGNGAVLVGVGHLCRHVAVGRGNVAQCVGTTVGIGSPVADTDATPVKEGILLINREEVEVNYNLDDHPYTMNAGYRQTLAAGRSWVIAFDRGGSFGEARYTLSEGTYKLSLTEEGWALFKHTFDVNIDNGENPFEFRYIVDNEHQTLPSGRVNKHSSLYPLFVRFDNGKGQTKAKRIESGTYEVAVTQENTLDLFAEDAVAEPSIGPPQPNPTPAATTTSATLTGATTTAVGDAFAGNPFGGRGDWRPSLFVSDVPEVDYFGDPEVAGS